MIARSRLQTACQLIAEMEEPMVEDIGRPLVARLREAGLVAPGCYRLNGSWERLWVVDHGLMRSVRPDDMEARICRALEAGPMTRGGISATCGGDTGEFSRALHYLERGGDVTGPDLLVLTEDGYALAYGAESEAA